MESRRPVEVLPERSAEALADWLLVHPGVDVICRDRANGYSEGASRGAPAVKQVADRWHLWHNPSLATERLVARLRSQWVPPVPEKKVTALSSKPEGIRAQKVRARHAAMHALMAKGAGIGFVVNELRLDPKTVRKCMNAATPEELIGSPTGRQSSLDGCAHYLTARWAEGCHSTSSLHQELADRGLKVSERTVRRFLLRLKEGAEPAARPPVPKNREVTTMILRHPDGLPEDDRVTVKELRDRCGDLNTACGHITRFAEMLTTRSGQDKLEDWVHDAECQRPARAAWLRQRITQGLRRRHGRLFPSTGAPARSRDT
ncbi:transposase [Streptomyces sp. NPDC020799]|uniref:transposase n=1 Tax=Streptomyces sp. NPDC020799 TaxID=3365091 RepID=UPI00379683B2